LDDEPRFDRRRTTPRRRRHAATRAAIARLKLAADVIADLDQALEAA
jgi:hypothetical protein